jgi:hypothetical protein
MSSAPAAAAAAAAASTPTIRGARVYPLSNGETTSELIEIPLTVLSEHGKLSPTVKATSVIFRQTTPNWDTDFHNAPSRYSTC